MTTDSTRTGTTTTPNRPRSPWTGSAHEVRHRWQLDHLGDLDAVVAALHDLAAELACAHAAGWWLAEPMRGGHLLAARASRRQRARSAPAAATDAASDEAPHLPGWRLRVVDEPPAPGEQVLDCDAVPATPVLHLTGGRIEQVGGPAVAAAVLASTARQAAGLTGRWALGGARVGPARDLVADGSALRLHTVVDGALLRTREVLTFQHAADGATTLAQAGAAYARLAHAAEALAAAGGRLGGVDDGFVQVDLGAAG